jgi:hypothetical protein
MYRSFGQPKLSEATVLYRPGWCAEAAFEDRLYSARDFLCPGIRVYTDSEAR